MIAWEELGKLYGDTFLNNLNELRKKVDQYKVLRDEALLCGKEELMDTYSQEIEDLVEEKKLYEEAMERARY